MKSVSATIPNPAQATPSASSLPHRQDARLLRLEGRMPHRVEAPPVVRYWHLLSFDAPTVAVVWSLTFAWAARVRLPFWLLALQALVVWAVYVGDRLLDARSSLRRDGEGMRERHFFHWRHRTLLTPLAVAASCVAAWIALHWMPIAAKERDSLLGAASLAYFTRVHSGDARSSILRFASKEFLVGVLFTAGCALPAWTRGAAWTLLVPAVFFAVLAWLNCRAIEEWEAGQRRTGILPRATGIAAVGVLAAILMAHLDPRAAALLAAGAVSAALLALLDRSRQRMTAVLLRAAADLVLLTPIALLAVQAVRR